MDTAGGIQICRAISDLQAGKSFTCIDYVAMPADNYEPEEDPLPGSNSAPVLDDEEEETGAGVDYRRMFKGYSSPLGSHL